MTAHATEGGDQDALELAAETIVESLSFEDVIAGVPGAPPAGPPFPEHRPGVSVYDYAGIFSPETEASAAQTVASIAQATSVPVVVYTQFKPSAITPTTVLDAAALKNEWNVRGLTDNGLVILFNMTRPTCQPEVPGNGQVQLYAGEDFAKDYVSDAERQQIFDEKMLPLLVQCDLDGALLAALDAIEAGIAG
jgi:uncharacterized membrane protein YgcG